MADLINLTRLKEYLTNTPSADDSSVLPNIITAASATLEKWTNRVYNQTTYDELYDGTGTRSLLLDHYPIISVSRVATGLTDVLRVQHTDTSASRATIAVTSTGVTLVSVASGTTTTTPLTFASYTTLTLLAAAISAVSGWTAEAVAPYGSWASADLRSPQGALNAKRTAYLPIHVDDLDGFTVSPAVGELAGCFARGTGNYRVVYSANYASVPADIQQVCCELCAIIYKSRKLDLNLQAQSLGVWSWTRAATSAFDALTPASRMTVAKYKSYRVPKNKNGAEYWR